MAKPNPYEKEMLKVVGIRQFDQNAWTIAELAKKSGRSEPQMAKMANEAIRNGTWEQTWKRTANGYPIRAYRPKRKK